MQESGPGAGAGLARSPRPGRSGQGRGASLLGSVGGSVLAARRRRRGWPSRRRRPARPDTREKGALRHPDCIQPPIPWPPFASLRLPPAVLELGLAQARLQGKCGVEKPQPFVTPLPTPRSQNGLFRLFLLQVTDPVVSHPFSVLRKAFCQGPV